MASIFSASTTRSRRRFRVPTRSPWVPHRLNPATTGLQCSASNDLVYSVRANPTSSVLNAISFQLRTPWRLGQWTKLTVSFMAENRNDVELGSRIIDTAFIGGCSAKSQQLSFNFVQQISLTPTVVVRLFVNGISETSNGGSNFELRLSSVTPGSLGVTFTVTINGASNIDSVYLSYMVYDSNSFGIPAIDGVFDRTATFNPVVQQIPTTKISTFNYALYGLSSFDFNSQYGVSFSVQVSSTFSMTVTGLQNIQSYIAVSYFLIQGSCGACNGYPYLNGINCVSSCPQNFQVNGICQTPAPTVCPAYSSYNGSTCVCIQYYYNISGSCQQCPPGTIYNGYQCVQSGIICMQNAFFNQSINQCQCNTNFYNISGSCQQCPANTQWNGYQCVQVISPCPAGSSINPQTGTCQCNQNQGFYLIGGSCQQCAPGSQWNGQYCAPYMPSITCTGNTFLNTTINQCQCATGYFNISGSCQQCAPGSQWNGQYCAPFLPPIICAGNSFLNTSINQCQCNTNFYNISGSCQQCAPGSQWNGQYCAPFLPPIVCQANAFLNASTNQCQCATNFYNISGSCQQCAPGSQWNGQYCAPVVNPSGPGVTCPYGTNCDVFCSNYANTVYNPSTNQCVCSGNTYYINGICQSCPQGWQYNGATCVQSLNCPTNSVPSGNTCVCINGYMQTPIGCVPNGVVILPPNPNPNRQCTEGMYYNQRNQGCVLCMEGCSVCSSSNSCTRCNRGYTAQNRRCREVCGDGIRFVLPCDDGNSRNGDGCSSSCQIESGWSCFGGSPTTPDSCTRNRPSSIMIYPTGQTHSTGKIMANVRVSWLPTNLTSGSCSECLEVRIISGANTAKISSQYTQGTSYSFSIVFDFVREPITDFKYQVRINPALQGMYFEGIDISYTAVVNTTPSVMALNDPTDTLDLSMLTTSSTPASLTTEGVASDSN